MIHSRTVILMNRMKLKNVPYSYLFMLCHPWLSVLLSNIRWDGTEATFPWFLSFLTMEIHKKKDRYQKSSRTPMLSMVEDLWSVLFPPNPWDTFLRYMATWTHKLYKASMTQMLCTICIYKGSWTVQQNTAYLSSRLTVTITVTVASHGHM